jgi:hypothetical protein
MRGMENVKKERNLHFVGSVSKIGYRYWAVWTIYSIHTPLPPPPLFPHFLFAPLHINSKKKLFLSAGGGGKSPRTLARPNLWMCEWSSHPSLRWLLVVMVISCLYSYTELTAVVCWNEAVTVYLECRYGWRSIFWELKCVAVAGKTRYEKPSSLKNIPSHTMSS